MAPTAIAAVTTTRQLTAEQQARSDLPCRFMPFYSRGDTVTKVRLDVLPVMDVAGQGDWYYSLNHEAFTRGSIGTVLQVRVDSSRATLQ